MPTAPLHVWRRAAVALCEWACGYEQGRRKDDPVYLEVTEGRDGPGPEQRRRYSSCGDLAHWMLARLGVREPWINRTDDGVHGPWQMGVNVSRLAFCPIARSWRPQIEIEPGDVVIVWNSEWGQDAHVMVALKWEGDKLHTANYGAGGMSPALSPGARLGAAEVRDGRYGARKIQRVISLADVVPLISAVPDLRGAALTGEELDALDGGKGAA